jgi:D-methionine transport system ATP-binding protein
MIKMQNVSKSFTFKNKTVQVLKDINLEVTPGEIFGIIGRSGAGKSTIIKCLNLLEKPDSGSIIVDGIDLTKITKPELRMARQKIGVIFQGFNLLNSKTVFANVALPLVLQGNHTEEQIKTKVMNLLELVGLTDFANKYPKSLSGGQKQRVGIARALATDPKVLLSDEATSALDPQTTNSILELLLDINRKLGLTIVLITHEIEVVRKICDRVAVIDAGTIVECRNTVDVILHPQHELTRKLIIEEETNKYLEQVTDFYKFEKTDKNHLIVLSFLGDQTFQPILSRISRRSGMTFSILKGELGRIKNTPFGQLLLELNGDNDQLQRAFEVLKEVGLHYEVLH